MRPILIWFSAIRAKSGFVECVNAKAITTSNIGEQFSALEIWFKMFPAGFKDYKKIKTFYSSHYLLKKKQTNNLPSDKWNNCRWRNRC